MKTSKIFLPIVLFLLVFSCTIEKRLYNKGWHIETKQRLKQQPEVISQEESNIQTTESANKVPTTSITEPENTFQTESVTESTDQLITAKTEALSIPEKELTTAVKPIKRYREPTIEPFGLASFSSLGLALLSLAFSLIPGLSVLQVVTLICLVLATILGVISFIRWRKKSPGTYKMKWLTWVGTFGGLAGILFLAISLLFIISNYK